MPDATGQIRYREPVPSACPCEKIHESGDFRNEIAHLDLLLEVIEVAHAPAVLQLFQL